VLVATVTVSEPVGGTVTLIATGDPTAVARLELFTCSSSGDDVEPDGTSPALGRNCAVSEYVELPVDVSVTD